MRSDAKAGDEQRSEAAQPGVRRRGRPVGSGNNTRERIVDAAEKLFAENPLASVSLRSVTAAAGVNQASLNYHFGTREALLEAIFERRSAPLNDERMAQLEACRPDKGPMLEQIISAFVKPLLLEAHDYDNGGARFMRLRARIAADGIPVELEILGRHFNPTSRAFLDALSKELPHLSAEDVGWRFHILLGTVTFTISDNGRTRALTKGACDPADIATTMHYLVPMLCNVFAGETRQATGPMQKQRKSARSRTNHR